MEYNQEKREINLRKKILNKLDKFAMDFASLLKEYVIVSGYVAILLGRSRATEDIDLLVPEMGKEKFNKLWGEINKNNFDCINTSKPEEAFGMLKEHAIRFFKRAPIPNIEFKIIKNDLDRYSFDNRIKVILKQGELFISPIELQIAYKLFLGSEKDIEDAKHLYNLFEEKINKEELLYLIDKLKVKDKFEILKKQYGTKFRKT